MPTDPYSPSTPRRRSILPILLLVLIAALIGMGVMGWLFYRYDAVADRIHPPTVVAVRQPVRPPMQIIRPVAVSAPTLGNVATDQRVDMLERKVDQLQEQAQAATGEASRAEALLLAFAARRAIDRGQPLGYIEGLLRERFGGVEPQAVAAVISASRQPVTIEQLRQQLDAAAPQLSQAGSEEGWWDATRRELGSLISIRKAGAPSQLPADRVGRSRDYLAVGRVDAALAEMARLPQQPAIASWIALARRYVQARVALDRIETAALLRPADSPPLDATTAS
jgi:outer membrane murein-binding lipoprotein Lpp